MKIKIVTMVIVGMMMMSCPDPQTYFLFWEPNVAKVSFMENGECNLPFYFTGQPEYTPDDPARNYPFYVTLEQIDHRVINGGIDDLFADLKTCSLYIIHQTNANYEDKFENFSTEYVPLSLHALEICSGREYHFKGNIPTSDISTIPDCAKMLNGWKSDEKSYIDECLSKIPITHQAVMGDATDFEWPMDEIEYYQQQCK
jgi:hypothetical protein